MADKSGIIRHKGKDILIIDYSNVDSLEELRNRVNKGVKLEKSVGGKDILEIIDVTGSYADPEMMDLLKETALETAGFVKKTAIVGVSGVKKILLTIVNKFSGQSIEPKESIEEAKDWLVED